MKENKSKKIEEVKKQTGKAIDDKALDKVQGGTAIYNTNTGRCQCAAR